MKVCKDCSVDCSIPELLKLLKENTEKTLKRQTNSQDWALEGSVEVSINKCDRKED